MMDKSRNAQTMWGLGRRWRVIRDSLLTMVSTIREIIALRSLAIMMWELWDQWWDGRPGGFIQEQVAFWSSSWPPLRVEWWAGNGSFALSLKASYWDVPVVPIWQLWNWKLLENTTGHIIYTDLNSTYFIFSYLILINVINYWFINYKLKFIIPKCHQMNLIVYWIKNAPDTLRRRDPYLKYWLITLQRWISRFKKVRVHQI
jgi:hypothetical protein